MPTSFNILRGNTVTIANKPLTEGLMTIDTDKKKVSVDWDSNGTLERIGFSSGDVTANSSESGSSDLEGLLIGGKGYKVLPIDSDLVLGEDDITLSDIIDNKADVDDYGVDLIVKRVMTNLTAPTKNTDPYVYRKTPTAKTDVVDMHKIVGASVVWNQILQNGNFADISIWVKTSTVDFSVSNNVGTVEVTTTSGDVYLEHTFTSEANKKYLIIADAKVSGTGAWKERVYYNGVANNTTVDISGDGNWHRLFVVVNNTTASTSNRVRILEATDKTVGDKAQVKNVMLVDLTAMFGTTIADYVYTLETSQSGSGIAWLQSYGFFTEDYYAYKQNKLESGCVSAKKIVGFNQWNEHWENGYRDSSTGLPVSSDLAIRSVEPIKLVKGKTYYRYIDGFNSNMMYGQFYDSEMKFIEQKAIHNRLITPSANACYMHFNISTSDNTYKGKICINISDTAKNGTYEPYTETTYPISPITLRGLFKLSTDKLTVDGDEYNADGSVTRKYGIVNLGDLDWTYKDSDPNTDFAYFQSTSDLDKASNVNLLCARYITMPSGRTSLTADKTISTYNTSSQIKKLVIRDDSYTDAQTFKTAMSGVYLIYELATPTTEQTTPFTETEIVGSTEEFIDYEVAQNTRDIAIPCGHDSDYYQYFDLPELPTDNNTYLLTCTVTNGEPNITWERS